MLWLGGGQVTSLVLQIALRLALARLLAPSHFGLVAMAVVFTTFCSQLADLGLGPALVQRKDLTELHKSTAFWAAGAIALVLTALFLAGAPWIGRFYGTSDLVPIVRALSLSLLLGFPESIYRYLYERRLSFRIIGLRRLIGVSIGGAVGISLALAGAGVWALVAEQLVRSAAGSLLYAARADWRPSLTASWAALAEMWSYSRSIVGQRLVNFLNRNLDNLLIGRFLGPAALGFYGIAYQGVLLPLQQVARPIASVGFPAFASIQNDRARCRRVYLSALRVSLLVATPLPLLAIFLSPTAIPLLLGDKWLPAVVPFQILSAVALIQVGMSLSPPLFNALGRADLSFKWTLIALVANSLGIVIGLRWGIAGVAWGYLAAVATTCPIQFAMAGRLIGLPIGELLGVFARMAASILAASIAPTVLLRLTDLAPLPHLALGAALVLLGFALFTRLLAAGSWALLRRSTESVV